MSDTSNASILAANGAVNSVGAMGSVASAAAAAEKVVESVMKVEPMIAGIAGMFVPGMSMVQPWIVMLAPFLERALNDLATNNNGDVLAAFLELVQHVTKGQPNASPLAPMFPEASFTHVSNVADPSTQGSG